MANPSASATPTAMTPTTSSVPSTTPPTTSSVPSSTTPSTTPSTSAPSSAPSGSGTPSTTSSTPTTSSTTASSTTTSTTTSSSPSQHASAAPTTSGHSTGGTGGHAGLSNTPTGHGHLAHATVQQATDAASPLASVRPLPVGDLFGPLSPKPLLPHVPAQLLPASWLGLAITIALVLNGIFLSYLFAVLVPFWRRRPLPAGDESAFDWHFLVPCRDEEAVIGGTLAYLTKTFPAAHVWVIDDDSEDATASIVAVLADGNPHVHLVQRRRPNARTGKSDALNAAYRQLCDWLPDDVDRDRVVVGVVDADGRPAASCLKVIAAGHLFGRHDVGAVQIEVRMINRDDRRPLPGRGRFANGFGRLLIRLQDIEFRAVVSACQMARRWLRTVAMGGNGQFMRLTALDAIGAAERRPWRGSLQEDFEVGLHALLAGFRTEFTADTFVDQEALPQLSRLVAQRARWSQGMMQCLRYLPAIWTSPKLRLAGVLELTYCLLQPWVQMFATLLYPLPWIVLVATYLHHPDLVRQFGADGGWTMVAVYVVSAFLQLAIWGLAYRRKCEPGIGRLRAAGYGGAFSMMAYVSYVATWRALGRLVRGRTGWAKTRRNAEVVASATTSAIEA